MLHGFMFHFQTFSNFPLMLFNNKNCCWENSSTVSFSKEIHRKTDDAMFQGLMLVMIVWWKHYQHFSLFRTFFHPKKRKKLCESHSSFHILYFLVLHSHTNQFYFVVVNKRMLYLVIVLHITAKNIYSSCSC